MGNIIVWIYQFVIYFCSKKTVPELVIGSES